MQRPTRVLAYVRVSGAEQGRSGTSLDAQREEIARYCAASWYPEPVVYVEVESAGAEKLERRAELRSLLASVTSGDLVVVAKQDRWSRDTLFYLQSTRDIVSRGARFLSLAERFDPSTPEGAFAATVMAAVAEQERERIRARTVGRRKELRASGWWVEGPAPFGYRLESRRLVIDEPKADLVREAHRRSQDGQSLEDLARWLIDRGHPTFDKQLVSKMLSRRWYVGELEAQPGVWVATHEPIVDAATWERTQAALRSRRAGGRKALAASRTAGWLGRGLLSCGLCGRRLGAAWGGGPKSRAHREYYRCGGRRCGCEARPVRVDALDLELAELVRARLVELRHDLARPPSSPGPAQERAEVARARVARLEARRVRTLDMVADGLVSREEARDRLAKVDAELAAARRDVEQETARAGRKVPETRHEQLAEVDVLRRAWERATVAERREILGALAERVDVVGLEVRVTWRA